MLLRFAIENFGSFKDVVEFNSFPSCKSHNHDNHKVTCNHATALRMSAIYGANGAGKSNLVIALDFLLDLVRTGSLQATIPQNYKFKFDDQCTNKPSELAIEFYHHENIYYYHISFDNGKVLLEELLLSKKTTDTNIFTRDENDIKINENFGTNAISAQFTDALQRLVRPDMLLLSFLGKDYPGEIQMAAEAYDWLANTVEIVRPDALTGTVPHMLDTMPDFAAMVNRTMPELKTGIERLDVCKEVLTENEAKDNPVLLSYIKKARQNPGIPQVYFNADDTNVTNIICEDDIVYRKTLIPIHKTLDGSFVSMPLANEPDGTRRLIEYMPLLYSITHSNKVYVVDEIERSMHPIMIKELIKKLSDSDSAKGQLIFTTHESSLLDQDIFRPDEVWFAQKDVEQATQLYPLSDFNIHKTANIENGYLNGRYGGIPFLSNLHDLHW